MDALFRSLRERARARKFLLLSVWLWPWLLALFGACSALYLVWCVLAWRCAGNVDHRMWGSLGRVSVGIAFGSFVTECLLILAAPLS